MLLIQLSSIFFINLALFLIQKCNTSRPMAFVRQFEIMRITNSKLSLPGQTHTFLNSPEAY